MHPVEACPTFQEGEALLQHAKRRAQYIVGLARCDERKHSAGIGWNRRKERPHFSEGAGESFAYHLQFSRLEERCAALNNDRPTGTKPLSACLVEICREKQLSRSHRICGVYDDHVEHFLGLLNLQAAEPGRKASVLPRDVSPISNHVSVEDRLLSAGSQLTVKFSQVSDLPGDDICFRSIRWPCPPLPQLFLRLTKSGFEGSP